MPLFFVADVAQETRTFLRIFHLGRCTNYKLDSMNMNIYDAYLWVFNLTSSGSNAD